MTGLYGKNFFLIVEYFAKPSPDSDSSTPNTSNRHLLETLILKNRFFDLDFRISGSRFSKIMLSNRDRTTAFMVEESEYVVGL